MLRIRKAGYDEKVPGPTLQVRRGEELWVHAVNETAEPMAIHWHGVRVANTMDGAPPLTQAPIAPGESFDYRFIAPDAGTFWYHQPVADSAGFYGAFIVEEATPVEVDRDVTLIVTKTPLNGSAFTINGAMNFETRARVNERLRLRFLNATAQTLELRVANLPLFVMATDGQPAQPFAAREGRLTLGPGNRIDVFADCTLAPGSETSISIGGREASSQIGRLVCETTDTPGRTAPREDPKPLPPNPLPERMEFRDAFRLEAAIGQRVQGNPLFTVRRGRTVVLGFSKHGSDYDYLHPYGFIHLHGHSFRLLDALDDGWKPFWLDTMPMAPGGKARIAFVADNPGKWLIEGLNDQNAWFEVT